MSAIQTQSVDNSPALKVRSWPARAAPGKKNGRLLSRLQQMLHRVPLMGSSRPTALTQTKGTARPLPPKRDADAVSRLWRGRPPPPNMDGLF
jgi:hypothetical protein